MERYEFNPGNELRDALRLLAAARDDGVSLGQFAGEYRLHLIAVDGHQVRGKLKRVRRDTEHGDRGGTGLTAQWVVDHWQGMLYRPGGEPILAEPLAGDSGLDVMAGLLWVVFEHDYGMGNAPAPDALPMFEVAAGMGSERDHPKKAIRLLPGPHLPRQPMPVEIRSYKGVEGGLLEMRDGQLFINVYVPGQLPEVVLEINLVGGLGVA